MIGLELLYDLEPLPDPIYHQHAAGLAQASTNYLIDIHPIRDGQVRESIMADLHASHPDSQ